MQIKDFITKTCLRINFYKIAIMNFPYYKNKQLYCIFHAIKKIYLMNSLKLSWIFELLCSFSDISRSWMFSQRFRPLQIPFSRGIYTSWFCEHTGTNLCTYPFKWIRKTPKMWIYPKKTQLMNLIF